MKYVYLQPDDEIEIGGETNDVELFENDWCPLFGSPPDLTYIMTSNDPLSRSESVILDARELWDVKPYQRPITEAEKKSFESSGRILEDIPKYPKWQIDIAQDILRIHPKVKGEADIVYWEDGRPLYANEPLNENWKVAVRIVKDSIAPRLNEQIKDYHILSIFAIAEAWDALKEVLYHKKDEDNPDIMRQVLVAANLLAKSKELSSKEEVNDLKPKAEYAEENLLKGNVFRKKRGGDSWDIVYDGTNIHPNHLKGFDYIHYLLSNPNREFRVIELVSEINKTFPPKDIYNGVNTEEAEGQLIEENLTLSSSDTTVEIMDNKTINDCRNRQAELKIKLDDAIELKNDEDRKRIGPVPGEMYFFSFA